MSEEDWERLLGVAREGPLGVLKVELEEITLTWRSWNGHTEVVVDLRPRSGRLSGAGIGALRELVFGLGKLGERLAPGCEVATGDPVKEVDPLRVWAKVRVIGEVEDREMFDQAVTKLRYVRVGE